MVDDDGVADPYTSVALADSYIDSAVDDLDNFARGRSQDFLAIDSKLLQSFFLANSRFFIAEIVGKLHAVGTLVWRADVVVGLGGAAAVTDHEVTPER